MDSQQRSGIASPYLCTGRWGQNAGSQSKDRIHVSTRSPGHNRSPLLSTLSTAAPPPAYPRPPAVRVSSDANRKRPSTAVRQDFATGHTSSGPYYRYRTSWYAGHPSATARIMLITPEIYLSAWKTISARAGCAAGSVVRRRSVTPPIISVCKWRRSKPSTRPWQRTLFGRLRESDDIGTRHVRFAPHLPLPPPSSSPSQYPSRWA